MQQIFIYDNTIEGLFTTIYKAYNFTDIKIVSRDFQLEFGNIKTILTNKNYSARILEAIINFGGIQALEDIKKVFISSCENKEIAIMRFFSMLVEHKKNAYEMLHDKAVIAFLDILNKVNHEIHRFEGFLRFSKTSDGFYYAKFAPDHNITKYVMPLFCERFDNQNFIIHDVKRNIIGAFSSLQNDWKLFQSNEILEVFFDEEEQKFSELFKLYFKTVSIESRKNKKQQDRCMPNRYREFMDETKN